MLVEQRRGELLTLCRALVGGEQAVLVLGDLNVRDEEVEPMLTKAGLREARYDGATWDPKLTRYDPDWKKQPQGAFCFDRVLFAGGLWAEAYRAGQCRQFCDGQEFFLSDHCAVLALVDVHRAYLGRAGVTLMRERRAAVARRRDVEARDEQLFVRERQRAGREEAAMMRARAADRDRVEVKASARKAAE